MKTKKNPIIAGILNFIFWGIGYLYLKKKSKRAFCLIPIYLLVWIFSFWYLSVAGLLDFVGIFWIIVWFLWVSIYLSLDAYKIAKVKK